MSFPASPQMTSFPGVPSSRSFPGVPWIVHAGASIPPALPASTSAAATPIRRARTPRFYGDLGSVEDTTLDSFRRQIETNLIGTIIVTQAAIPVLRRQHRPFLFGEDQ